jgi:hypothetical protein
MRSWFVDIRKATGYFLSELLLGQANAKDSRSILVPSWKVKIHFLWKI